MSKEINLLPRPRRRQLTRRFFQRELRRFGMSLFWGVFIVTLTGVTAFITLTVASSIFFPVQDNELEQAIVDYRAETRAIQARNDLIREMQRRHEERLAWSAYLPQLLASLPAGTQLQTLSGDRETRQLALAGRAAARSALVVLESKLKAFPWVKEVVFPAANLLERVSPEFSVTLKL